MKKRGWVINMTDKCDRFEQMAWDDIKAWSQEEIAEFLGILPREVDYCATKDAVEKWADQIRQLAKEEGGD